MLLKRVARGQQPGLLDEVSPAVQVVPVETAP